MLLFPEDYKELAFSFFDDSKFTTTNNPYHSLSESSQNFAGPTSVHLASSSDNSLQMSRRCGQLPGILENLLPIYAPIARPQTIRFERLLED